MAALAMNLQLDPDALRFARVLYRFVRLKMWQRRRDRERRERARIKALYSIPPPKYWPGDPR